MQNLILKERCFVPQTFAIHNEKILSSHDFFQLSKKTKSNEILLCNEAFLFVDDSTNTFDVSSDI